MEWFNSILGSSTSLFISARCVQFYSVKITLHNNKISMFPSLRELILTTIFGFGKWIWQRKIFSTCSFCDIQYVEVLHFKGLKDNCKYYLHLLSTLDVWSFFLKNDSYILNWLKTTYQAVRSIKNQLVVTWDRCLL